MHVKVCIVSLFFLMGLLTATFEDEWNKHAVKLINNYIKCTAKLNVHPKLCE